MSGNDDDRFAPPDAPSLSEPGKGSLELGTRAPRRGVGTDDAARPVEIPQPRGATPYKKLPGGAGNTMLFALAGVGLLALLGGGAYVLKNKISVTPAPAPAPPPKPIEYKPLYTDDAVLITVEVAPRSAQLFIDGEPMPSNPVRLPRGTKSYKVTAANDGFDAAETTVIPDGPKVIKLKLAKAK